MAPLLPGHDLVRELPALPAAASLWAGPETSSGHARRMGPAHITELRLLRDVTYGLAC